MVQRNLNKISAFLMGLALMPGIIFTENYAGLNSIKVATTNAGLKGLVFGKKLGAKLLSDMASTTIFTGKSFGNAGKGIVRELGFGLGLAVGTLAAIEAWRDIKNIVHDKILSVSCCHKDSPISLARQFWRFPNDGTTCNKIEETVFKSMIISMILLHATRAGSLPKLSLRNLILPAGAALAGMTAFSSIGGAIEYKKSGHNYAAARKFNNFASKCRWIAPLGLAGWAIYKRNVLAAAH